MSASPSDVQPRPGVREQVATRIAFFVAGLAMATWAPLVPVAKARLGLEEGQLGVLLLCLGLGSVLTMPFSGGLAARFGCRAVILAAGALGLISLPILATAPSVPVLAGALLLLGAGIGSVDVVMNVQASIVENSSGRAMMSGFHGLFSVGSIAGSAGVTALLNLRVTPLVATTAVTVLSVLLLGSFVKGLLPYGGDANAPAVALPRGRVFLLGALCFVLFLSEGSVLDWSGVLLSTTKGLANEQAGIGYVAFAVTMTIGRLLGDRIVSAVGPRRIVLLGALCSAVGYVLAALAPSWVLSVIGFALVGLGGSNVVPVMFSAAGRQTAMPANLAMAAVTSMGYLGLLMGPAVIGFVAQGSSLPIALLIVAGLLLAVAASARAATTE